MTAGPGPVYAVALSRMAPRSPAPTATARRPWNAASQQEIGTPIPPARARSTRSASSPDGTTPITADASNSSKGRARQWDVAFRPAC